MKDFFQSSRPSCAGPGPPRSGSATSPILPLIVRKLVPVAKQPFAYQGLGQPGSWSVNGSTQNLKPVIPQGAAGVPVAKGGFLDEDAPTLLSRLPDYLAEFNPVP